MRNKNIKKILNKFTNPPAYLNIGLGALVLVLIVAYLWQINSTTQLGVELRDLQHKQTEASELNRDLQITVAEYQSIANLQTRLANLPLAKVSELDYIELTSVETVAKR